MEFLCTATTDTKGSTTFNCTPSSKNPNASVPFEKGIILNMQNTQPPKNLKNLGTHVAPIPSPTMTPCDACSGPMLIYAWKAGDNAVTLTFSDGSTILLQSSDGINLDWTASNTGVTKVGILGDIDWNIYEYTGYDTVDTALHAPVGRIRRVAVCFNPYFRELAIVVSKTATGSYTREYDWTLNCTSEDVLLSTGQVYNAHVALTATAATSILNVQVGGSIRIQNQSSVAVNIIDILESLSTASIVGPALPYYLGVGAEVTYTYQAPLDFPAPGTNQVTVTVEPTTPCAGDFNRVFNGYADYSFDNPNIVDNCITLQIDAQTPVTFPNAGVLGTVVLPSTIPVGPYSACGVFSVPFTGLLATCDTQKQITSDTPCTIHITVPCLTGCVLTAGYWKTHSQRGPATYDDAWQLIPGGLQENTIFFLSKQSYYQVLWQQPKGNAYYILAQQFIAAYLNQLNGASIATDVYQSFDAAKHLFEQYTPQDVASWKLSDPRRVQFINLAVILNDYNNGKKGTPHCSEDP